VATGTAAARSRSASATGAGVTPGSGKDDRGRAWLTRLESPLAAYYLVLGSTVALVAIGLVMVLSSSSVESYRLNDGDSYAVFSKQAMFAAIGLPLAVAAALLPIRWWRRLSWLMLLVAAAGLVAVAVIGHSVKGNQNWIKVGGVTLQPSEAAKLALVVWTATVLAAKQQLLTQVSHVLIPVVPVAVGLLGLVMLGRDLGTTLVLLALAGALLFTAGAPLRVFTVSGLAAAAVVAALVVSSDNRMQRIQNWLGGGSGTHDLDSNYQPLHGLWALATGGWWGVGLGASREKWSWLPEAHNDFIFAVIGEELGLAGTLVVLALFAAMGIGLFRLVLATDDTFVKIATGGVLAWVLGQAIINIGAVLGMLPVIGVPLPLVSSGGSALVTTLVGLGMVLGFARRVPGAPEALAARSGVVRRSFAVLPPRDGAGRSTGRSARRSRGGLTGRRLRPRMPGRRR
jgi:cell division protein FtsW